MPHFAFFSEDSVFYIFYFNIFLCIKQIVVAVISSRTFSSTAVISYNAEKKLSCYSETARRAMPLEILSFSAQLYGKSHQ